VSPSPPNWRVGLPLCLSLCRHRLPHRVSVSTKLPPLGGDVRVSGRANTPSWVPRGTAVPCFEGRRERSAPLTHNAASLTIAAAGGASVASAAEPHAPHTHVRVETMRRAGGQGMRVLKASWLTKRSRNLHNRYLNDNWKRRYFVLLLAADGGLALRYYVDNACTRSKLKGELTLNALSEVSSSAS
jgi:hypothetical protein